MKILNTIQRGDTVEVTGWCAESGAGPITVTGTFAFFHMPEGSVRSPNVWIENTSSALRGSRELDFITTVKRFWVQNSWRCCANFKNALESAQSPIWRTRFGLVIIESRTWVLYGGLVIIESRTWVRTESVQSPKWRTRFGCFEPPVHTHCSPFRYASGTPSALIVTLGFWGVFELEIFERLLRWIWHFLTGLERCVLYVFGRAVCIVCFWKSGVYCMFWKTF